MVAFDLASIIKDTVFDINMGSIVPCPCKHQDFKHNFALIMALDDHFTGILVGGKNIVAPLNPFIWGWGGNLPTIPPLTSYANVGKIKKLE